VNREREEKCWRGTFEKEGRGTNPSCCAKKELMTTVTGSAPCRETETNCIKEESVRPFSYLGEKNDLSGFRACFRKLKRRRREGTAKETSVNRDHRKGGD